MPQLKIQVVVANAADGSAQVYLGQPNTLLLRLVNQTDGPLTLTAGAPQSPPPPSGATALQLDLSTLFATPGEQSALQLSVPGWTAQYFDDPSYPVWVLAPDAPGTWTAADALTVTVGGLVPTVSTSSYFITLDVYNAGPGYASNYTPAVVVSNPPSTHKNLLDTLGVDVAVNPVSSFDPKSPRINYVGITKVPAEPYVNTIQLTLYNKSSAFPIVPPATPWGTVPPQFTVSFVPATEQPGYFALTTPDALDAFTISPTSGTLGWDAARLPGTPARWSLTPQPNNHAILGTGTQGVAQFELGNVRTQLVNGPTLMYLQYANIPGYDDGFATFLLDKQYAALSVEYLEVMPDAITVQNYAAQTVTLSWKVRNATLIEVDGVAAPIQGEGTAVVPVDVSRTFVLTAYDTITHAVASATARLTVTPELSTRWTPVGSIVAIAGGYADIPAGWALCDGANGTPDLKDAFIVGAGGSRAVNAADRFPRHRHPLGGFKVTSTLEEAGEHSHAMPSGWYARNLSCGKWSGIDAGGQAYQRSQNDGRHQHSLYVDYSATYTAENVEPVRPRWFALCYIMLLNPAQ